MYNLPQAFIIYDKAPAGTKMMEVGPSFFTIIFIPNYSKLIYVIFWGTVCKFLTHIVP